MSKEIIKQLSYKEEKNLTKEQKKEYYESLKKQFLEYEKKINFKKIKELIHPALLKAMSSKIKGNVTILDDEEIILDYRKTKIVVDGEILKYDNHLFNIVKLKYDIDTLKIYEIKINDEIINITDKDIQVEYDGKPFQIDEMIFQVENNNNILHYNGPIHYVANHTNSQDVPVVSKGIKDHYYVIAGDEVRYFDINGIFFNANGVEWVNRGDDESRAIAQQNITSDVIKFLVNDLHFIESTWNRTENLLMLPVYWGINIEATITGYPILPIVMDYNGDNIYIRMGKLIFVNTNDDRKESSDKLRDIMATMRWNVWDKYSHDYRDNWSRLRFYEEVIDKDLKDYPKLNPDQEDKYILKPYKDPAEIFSYINIRELNKDYTPYDEIEERDRVRYNAYKPGEINIKKKQNNCYRRIEVNE